MTLLLPDRLRPAAASSFLDSRLNRAMPDDALQPDHRLSSYDYFLPDQLVAQHPTAERDQSRLMVLDCSEDRTIHSRFDALAELLLPGDLLVVNDTKVFPARLLGSKESGGRVELLLLHYPRPCGPGQATAVALLRSSKRPRPGSAIRFAEELRARVEELLPDGKVRVALLFSPDADLSRLLAQHGQIPLPPYIRRPEGSAAEDVGRYQTQYACHVGSVAAPTAGLHFSDALLEKLAAMGVGRAAVTLHVGYGTFAPVRCNDIREHKIHEEFVSVPQETAQAVNAAKAAGGRIWAVGTTTARTLEFAATGEDGRIAPMQGLCGLYIHPGHRFRVVDNLITNFHLPMSSLLFLVSALAGRERTLAAYAEAVERGYRFFSYGDAMAVVVRK